MVILLAVVMRGTMQREMRLDCNRPLTLESAADTIYLCHDAKSRRGFAEGAVRAAEWLQGKKGFYEFKDIWRQV